MCVFYRRRHLDDTSPPCEIAPERVIHDAMVGPG